METVKVTCTKCSTLHELRGSGSCDWGCWVVAFSDALPPGYVTLPEGTNVCSPGYGSDCDCDSQLFAVPLAPGWYCYKCLDAVLKSQPQDRYTKMPYDLRDKTPEAERRTNYIEKLKSIREYHHRKRSLKKFHTKIFAALPEVVPLGEGKKLVKKMIAVYAAMDGEKSVATVLPQLVGSLGSALKALSVDLIYRHK